MRVKNFFRIFILITTVVFIGSCGASNKSFTKVNESSTSPASIKTISGYVIDDPVVGATIEVYDDKGNLIAEKENATDENGYFEISNVSLNGIKSLYIVATKDTLHLSTFVYPPESTNNIYITDYTTALSKLIDFMKINGNINLNFRDLVKRLSFNKGRPTNIDDSFYPLVVHIAEKIRGTRGLYSVFNDKSIRVKTINLVEGSIYDFPSKDSSQVKCSLPEGSTEVSFKNGRLVVADNITKPISLYCSVNKDGLIELINVRILQSPQNKLVVNLSPEKKIADISDIRVIKPSDDAVTIKTSSSPVVLRETGNNKVIIGKSILNFFPDGLHLKKPLILEIPQELFNKNGNFYLVNKDGSFEEIVPIVENGKYYLRIPHFSSAVYGYEVSNVLVTSSDETSASINWDKLKTLILNEDKELYSYSEDLGIYVPGVLLKHGYSLESLSKNIDVPALLSVVVLKNGKGALDFDGNTLSFDKGSIVIDYNIENQESEQQSDEIQYYMNLMLKFSNLLYAIEANRKGIEGLIKTIQSDALQDINTVSQNISQNIHEVQQSVQAVHQNIQLVVQEKKQYVKSVEKVLQNFAAFQKALLVETDKFKRFEMLLDKAIYYQNRSWNIPKGRLSEYQLALLEINNMLPEILEALKGKPEQFSRMKVVLYLYKMGILFRGEVEHNVSFKDYLVAKGIIKSYSALEKSIKKLSNVLEQMHNLLQNSSDFTKEKVFPLLSSLNERVSPLASKVLNKVLKAIKVIGKHSAPLGFVLKYYAVSLNYRFDDCKKKINVLRKLEKVLPEYKSEIESIEKKLIDGYKLNYHYPFLKELYVILLTYSGNNSLQQASVTLDIVQTLESYNIISKYLSRYDKELMGNLGSVVSIISSVANAANTWTGANSLAYLSATASTLAYKAINNNNLPTRERIKWYAIFQTISNYALASWYYYQGKIAEKSHGFWLDLFSNALDAGISVASNPTTLGLTDAAIKAWTNEQIVAAAWSLKHGINFWSRTSSEEDVLIADYLSRNAVYQFYTTGRVENLLKRKRDIALPPLNVYQTPSGYKIFSLAVKKGTFDRISIRLDKTDSNKYYEDIQTGKDTHAHTVYWDFRNQKHDLHVFPVNKGIYGAILDPKESGVINFAVGRNIKAIEILGWKREPSGVTPYYTYIDLSNLITKEVNEDRINNFLNSIQNEFDFKFDSLTLQSLDKISKFISNKGFMVINLQNGKTIPASKESLGENNYWIAIKYFNHSFYGIVFVRVNDEIYYEVKDFIFSKSLGNLNKLGDYDDILSLNHPFNELLSEAGPNIGTFSASYLQNLFPNLDEDIETLKRYVNSYFKRKITVKDAKGNEKQSYINGNEIVVDNTISSINAMYRFGRSFNGYPIVRICTLSENSLENWLNILNPHSPSCENFRLKWKISCNNDDSICLSWDKEENQISISFKKDFLSKKLYSSSAFKKSLRIFFSEENGSSFISDSINFVIPQTINLTPLIKDFRIGNIEQCQNKGYCVFDVNLDGSLTNYSIDFGDGNQEEKEATSLSFLKHKYEQSGDYKVTLKVCNGKLCSEKTIDVNINKQTVEPTLKIKKITVSPQIVTIKEGDELWGVTLSVETEAKNVKDLTCKYAIDGKIQDHIDCNGEVDILNPSIGTHTVTVYATAKSFDGEDLKTSENATFTVKLLKNSYSLAFLDENYEDNSTVNLNDGDTIKKWWRLRMSPTHSATLIVEKDTSKTCNLTVKGSLPTIKVGANEEFTIPIDFAMPSQEGEYECHFKIKDTSGNYYRIGNIDNIWIKIKVKANDLIASANLNANEIFVNDKVFVIAKVHKGNPPYNIVVDWGDGNEVFKNFDDNISIQHTYSQEGTYTVKVTITDSVGKQFTKAMLLKVSSQPDITTKWEGTLHLTKNGVSVDKGFNIVVTKKTANYTYYEYSSSYVPSSNDEVYYVQYDLPVPPEVIDLKNKFRMTFIVKSGEIKYYDREIWLTTNRKKYGIVFINEGYHDLVQENEAYGQLIAKDLETGEIKPNYYPELSDNCQANSLSIYAIEMDGDNLIVYKYSNGKYEELISYPDNTGDYLTKIGFNFRGNGKIILVKFEYDSNGDGKYDNGYLVLNTENKTVDWSKWTEEENEKETPQDYSSVISGKVIADSIPSDLKIRITPDVEQIDGDWGGIVCQINSDGTFGDKCVLHGDINNYTSDHTYQVVIFEDTDGNYRYDSGENSIWGVNNLSFDELKEITLSDSATLSGLDSTFYRETAILSPNDDTCWFNGQNATITWDTTQIQGNIVDIYILTDDPSNIDDDSPDVSVVANKFWKFVTTTQNTGSLTVDPAIFGGTGNAYKILIISDMGYWDMSNGAFNLNHDCNDQYTPSGENQTSNETINFADPNLEACVREALGIDENTPITKDMGKNLTYLYCDFRGITSLAGIENLTNLQTLYLDGNQISDISPLANLSNLQYLGLCDNSIEDFSPISNLNIPNCSCCGE